MVASATAEFFSVIVWSLESFWLSEIGSSPITRKNITYGKLKCTYVRL